MPSDEVEAKSLDVPRSSGTVAVVPVYGVIDSKRIYWADVFTEELSGLLAALVANEQIGAIVLDADTPGGSVYGTPEFAEQLYGYRKSKPIYAIATGMMASAGYWLGSAATKVFASPSSQAGSIGVWWAHVDTSRALEKEGLDVTLVKAGKYKIETNPFGPLAEEARVAKQQMVDTYYGQFTDFVAKARGRRPATVRNGFGEGRMLTAEHAFDEGLIDGIATLPELLGAIVPKRKGSRGASARARLAIEEAG
jgi:signal peptide peptidase SppA